MKEAILTITETVEGYAVKSLKWDGISNIYIGQIQDPVCGRKELFDGYVAVCWRANGSLLPKYGGNTRKDLYLKMP